MSGMSRVVRTLLTVLSCGSSRTRTVVEQVEKHDKSIALKGDLPQAVKQAVVHALLNEGDIARTLLKDPQVMASYIELIFDMLKQRNNDTP